VVGTAVSAGAAFVTTLSAAGEGGSVGVLSAHELRMAARKIRAIRTDDFLIIHLFIGSKSLPNY
jgi:hypothetical protein